MAAVTKTWLGLLDEEKPEAEWITRLNVATAKRAGLHVMWDNSLCGEYKVVTWYPIGSGGKHGVQSDVPGYYRNTDACLSLFENYLWTAQRVGDVHLFTIHLAERDIQTSGKTLPIAILKCRWQLWLERDAS